MNGPCAGPLVASPSKVPRPSTPFPEEVLANLESLRYTRSITIVEILVCIEAEIGESG